MNVVESFPQSYLFTVRVWSEVVGDNQIEWRGKICFIATQEEHYFRNWQAMVTWLETTLAAHNRNPRPQE